MVVGLSLSKEGGGCERCGGQICRGVKRTESLLLESPREHIVVSPAVLTWWDFTRFVNFLPYFLPSEGDEGFRCHVALTMC